MRSKSFLRPRWVGAGLYAAAGAVVGAATLFADGSFSGVRLREVAPLAALVGAGIGAAVCVEWPRRPSVAILRGAVAALVGLVFFSALYLFGDALIEAAQGGRPADAVAAAVDRLAARLPIAAPMAFVAFSAAGVLHFAAGLASGAKTPKNPSKSASKSASKRAPTPPARRS